MAYRFAVTRHPLSQLRDEMDRLLTGFLGWLPSGTMPVAGRGHPAANLWETADAVLVELEVPGVKPDQVDLSVVGGELTLTVSRDEGVGDGVTYHRRERPAGAFTRVLRLPVEVDADQVAAQLTNGVLTITLPKAEAGKPRRIQVAAG